jgi:FAD/FMN-containing dehydrogenase
VRYRRCQELSLSLEFIERSLSQIVGKDYVITDPAELEKYSKDQSFVPPRMPLMAVKVKTREEVQQVVRFANQYKIPLTPYSSGTTFQGAHIPSFPGITVDLSLMNRIHSIDFDSRTAIIEPGVTFKQLQDEAKKYGLRVLTAWGVPSYGSVLVTYLERTPLYSWPKYGGHWELMNFEVVLPTGEVIAFGAMALPWIKNPAILMGKGIGWTRLFCAAQGTLGIVTKGIVTLKTLHDTVQEVFFIPFERVDDVVEAIKEIQFIEVGEECFAINSLYLACLLSEKWPEEFEEMRSFLPKWTVVVILRGYKEDVECEEEDLKDLASKIKVELETELAGIKDARERILKEIEYPMGMLKLNRYKGACNFIPAYTLLINVIKLDMFVQSVAKEFGYPVDDIGTFILPIERGQAVYYEPSFFRDSTNPQDTEKVKNLWYYVADKLIDHGAYYERPYGPLAEMTYTRAARYKSALKRIKRLLDPNNIMNPGKLTL